MKVSSKKKGSTKLLKPPNREEKHFGLEYEAIVAHPKNVATSKKNNNLD